MTIDGERPTDTAREEGEADGEGSMFLILFSFFFFLL